MIFFLFSGVDDISVLISLVKDQSAGPEGVTVLCDYDTFSADELAQISTVGRVFPFLAAIGKERFIAVAKLTEGKNVILPDDRALPTHWVDIFRAAGVTTSVDVKTDNLAALGSSVFQQEKLKLYRRKLRGESPRELPVDVHVGQKFGDLHKVDVLYICLNASFGEAGTPGTYGLIAEVARLANVGVICPPPSENVVYRNPHITQASIPDVHRLNRGSLARIKKQVQKAAPKMIHMLGQRSAGLARHLREWGYTGGLIMDIRSPLVSENADTLKRLRGDLLSAQYYCDQIFVHCIGTIGREFPVKLVPMKVVPPGILKGFIQPRDGRSKKLRKFVFIGNIAKSRSLDGLINQLVSVHKKVDKSISLDIYGDGNDFERIKKLIRTMKAQKYVCLKGRRSQSELGVLLKEYDAGIAYVPNSDHFGVAPSLKSLEYSAAGLRVFVSDTQGHRDFSRDYNLEFEYFGEEQGDLASVIRRVRDCDTSQVELDQQIEAANCLNYESIVSSIVIPEYKLLGLNL